jgi:uncharacterized protein with HEPN domain
MRFDNQYLLDISEAADRISEYISGVERTDFLSHKMMKAAVVREIEIIGEAASRVSLSLKETHPEVPWKELAQLRNLYIHVYHRVKYEKVWTTAKSKVPRIAAAVAALIPSEPPDQSEESPT